MLRRGAPAVVLLGLLAGCGGTTAGTGTPDATVGITLPGLPLPDEPTGAAPPATTGPTTPPATSPPTTTAPAPSPTGRACPADVTRALPGPATFVAGYRTARFRLWFCRSADGRLFYRGVNRAGPAVTLPARAVPGGYEASTVAEGSTFVYRVTPARLVVTKDGKRILADPVTGTLSPQ